MRALCFRTWYFKPRVLIASTVVAGEFKKKMICSKTPRAIRRESCQVLWLQNILVLPFSSKYEGRNQKKSLNLGFFFGFFFSFFFIFIKKKKVVST